MKTKKFLSLVLSAAMILGVAVPVAAEPVSAEQSVEAEQQPIVENSITGNWPMFLLLRQNREYLLRT